MGGQYAGKHVCFDLLVGGRGSCPSWKSQAFAWRWSALLVLAICMHVSTNLIPLGVCCRQRQRLRQRLLLPG